MAQQSPDSARESPPDVPERYGWMREQQQEGDDAIIIYDKEGDDAWILCSESFCYEQSDAV